MNAVVNTSPLLFLSKINRLPILKKFGKIFVPSGVMAEIRRKQDYSLTAIIKASSDWLNIKSVKDKKMFDMLIKELGEGEAEVICLALGQKSRWVILDDQDARRFAHRYGLSVIGTLGILVWAKKKGLIASFYSEVVKLQKAGFYATRLLIENLLKETGESSIN